MNFGELLQKFKENEKPEDITPIIDDKELRNGMVAWKSVVIHYSVNEECDKKSESEQWIWLWDKVSFDINKFGVVAGCKPMDTQKLFERLKGLHLIYPDGTTNSYAQQYLQALIMSKLPKSKK